MKRLLLVFSFISFFNLRGMDAFGLEYAEEQFNNNSLQALILKDVIKNLETYELGALLALAPVLQDHILNSWKNKNLHKVNSAGCPAQWEIKQTIMPSGEDSYPGNHYLYSYVNSIALSADGKILAAVYKEKSIGVWVLAANGQFEFKQELNVGSGPIISLAMSGDGKTIAASFGVAAQIWAVDAHGAYVARQQLSFNADVVSLALSGNGDTFVAGCANSRYYIFNLIATRFYFESYSGISGGIVAISNYGKKVAISSFDNKKEVLGLQDDGRWALLRSFVAGWSGNISISDDGTIVLDNLDDGSKMLARYDNNLISLSSDSSYRLSKISANGKVAVSAASDPENKKSIFVWVANSEGDFVREPVASDQDDNIRSVAISADGKTIVSDSYAGQIAIWKFVEEDCKLTLPVAYAISKDQLTAAEKLKLRDNIDFGSLHSGIRAHLRGKGLSAKRKRRG